MKIRTELCSVATSLACALSALGILLVLIVVFGIEFVGTAMDYLGRRAPGHWFLWGNVALIAAYVLCPIFAIIASQALYRRLRWRLHDIGRCRSCDYNLTGNVSGICPECGTPVPEAATDSQ
jgi:hypothetical protein